MAHDEIGVPEALPRTLELLRERVGVAAIDRLWIFPPMRRGRRERGLVAVSTFLEGVDRRGLVSVTYVAEHSGKEGVKVEASFTPEGEAPADRFPTMMKGVVMRGGEERGEPREVEIEGSASRFLELLDDVSVVPAGLSAQ